MTNKKGMQYIIKVVVFVLVLAILTFIAIVVIGMESIEKADIFFGERFSRTMRDDQSFIIPMGNIFNYNLIEVIRSDT